MLKYKVGDVTNPEQTEGFTTVIVHCCNDIGVMGGGVALALRNKWPIMFETYREWYENDHYQDSDSLPYRHTHQPFVLGQVQSTRVAPFLHVCNLIGQRDVVDCLGLPPVRYEAIREGLRRLAYQMTQHPNRQFKVVGPRLGSGLSGGRWETIEQIIKEELSDFEVTIYDLERIQGTVYIGDVEKSQQASSQARPAELLEFGGQSKP